MNSASEFKQILSERLSSKGLDKETIPSFIRSMRICLAASPGMNHLKTGEQLQLMGWNDIDLDYHTLQITLAFFEAEADNQPESSIS